jgi:hypothetical protein
MYAGPRLTQSRQRCARIHVQQLPGLPAHGLLHIYRYGFLFSGKAGNGLRFALVAGVRQISG